MINIPQKKLSPIKKQDENFILLEKTINSMFKKDQMMVCTNIGIKDILKKHGVIVSCNKISKIMKKITNSKIIKINGKTYRAWLVRYWP